MMNDLLNETYLNNRLFDYLIAAGLVVVGVLLIRLFRKIIVKRLKAKAAKTETQSDDVAVNLLEQFMLPLFNIVVVYFAFNYLTLSQKAEEVLLHSMVVVTTYFSIRLVSKALQLTLRASVLRQENGEDKMNQMGGVTVIISIIVWVLGIVFLFDNLGFNVTAIVTGLGIGGIAIALAAQNILGDLFNYFVIFFDRPFEVGDFINVGDKLGIVEYIGIKTTRLKSLSGEQVVFSNTDLTNSRIHNFKKMQRRRVIFAIGIVYETPMEKVKEIPALIKGIISRQPKTIFDRAHFFKCGSFSLDFEVVYYVEGPDYIEYMDIQQNVNLEIFEVFQERRISFAYPTQTILLPSFPRKQELLNN